MNRSKPPEYELFVVVIGFRITDFFSAIQTAAAVLAGSSLGNEAGIRDLPALDTRTPASIVNQWLSH